MVVATPLAEHQRKLRVVSGRFRGHNLQLQPDKCQYMRREDTFYGHKIPQYRKNLMLVKSTRYTQDSKTANKFSRTSGVFSEAHSPD